MEIKEIFSLHNKGYVLFSNGKKEFLTDGDSIVSHNPADKIRINSAKKIDKVGILADCIKRMKERNKKFVFLRVPDDVINMFEHELDLCQIMA